MRRCCSAQCQLWALLLQCHRAATGQSLGLLQLCWVEQLGHQARDQPRERLHPQRLGLQVHLEGLSVLLLQGHWAGMAGPVVQAMGPVNPAVAGYLCQLAGRAL